jgi:predicted XRE-type DNA-binding protein
MSEDILDFEEGGENVFADIGVRDPEESLVRAKLAKQIADLIQRKGINQSQIGEILGVDQSKVSKLVRGRISGFTSDRLLKYLTALGCDVRIEVKEPRLIRSVAIGQRGRIVVAAG